MTGGVIETAIAIFAIATIFSMFGKGGCELYLPVMITILSIPFYVAAGVSQFIIMIQSLSMVAIYSRRHRLLDWGLAFILVLVVGVAAFLGAFFSKGIPPIYLKGTFALFLIISVIFILINKSVKPKLGKFGVWHRRFPGGEYDMQLFYVLIPVFIAGLLAGMLGISGGGLIIPICVLLGGVPIRIAMGTNSFIVLVSTFTGFMGHLFKGGMDWKLALIFGAATLFGSQIGSRMHAKVSEKFLKIGLAIILAVAAGWMIVKMFH